uniref:Ras-like protein family member 10B n=1 Tax=Anopheles quadriannulatus TaxID=34691 RepID=A0A182XAU7_ANOQN
MWNRLSPTNSNRLLHDNGPDPPWMQGPLKVAFLGASGVGRTSILQQFFKHDFPKDHIRTSKRTVYRSCLVCDTCIRELMVLDVPPQKYFPIDNLAEWNNGNPLGLRTVHTYVLVYDMGNLDTFQYCRNMRDQILESFNHRDFKIMVVGNKVDMVSNPHTQELKDISTLVRKHWRCGYVECSAKHNYKIGDIFKEMMGYPQFFKHDFPKDHIRTSKRTVYRSCLVCDTCIRELMVLDVPPQKYFPIDNLAEWNNGNPLGLRTVHTYVLVYDMGNLDTFQYCRNMRDQILESFNHRDFKIMVVGNKVDMVSNPHTQELKDISTLVRKHWRCGYVECSAKHNYKIGDIFKEMMGYPVGGTAPKLEFSQSIGSKNRCTIL